MELWQVFLPKKIAIITYLRKMFRNKKVSPILPYNQAEDNEGMLELFMENRQRISISGVQEKLSLLLEKTIYI